jgi:hypothetical protein
MRSISGALIASAISRWYGHRRTRPGAADTPSGSMISRSIHSEGRRRAGRRRVARALRRTSARVVMACQEVGGFPLVRQGVTRAASPSASESYTFTLNGNVTLVADFR